MEYSKLGKSDMTISRIGFGCMSLQENETVNKQLIGRALELGVNYFDTADLYEKGANEERIAKLLGADRKRIILATKVGNQWREDGNGWDWNPKKDYILAAVEKSLKRLQTDYIDLYQLHGGTIADNIDETIEAFELLKQQGKIRAYGISSIRPNVIREYVKRSQIVSVMMQYSLLDRRPEQECFTLLEQHDIAVLGRGGVAQGLLAGKPAKAYLDWSPEEVERAADVIRELTPEGSTAGQTAIRFVLHQQVMTSAVIGIRTLEQLEDSVHALDLPGLTKEEISILESAAPRKYYLEHI